MLNLIKDAIFSDSINFKNFNINLAYLYLTII